jgi:hypothetical protein
MAVDSKKRSPKSPPRMPSTPHAERRYFGAAELRRRAERDYIADADANGVEWHWEHGEYANYVALKTFRQWAADGDWHQQRLAYWRSIQDRLLNEMADKILKSQVAELGDMIEVKNVIVEMLTPFKQADGSIKRDKFGLPVFKVEVPSYDKLVKAYLDLDQRIGLRTGDVTERVSVAVAPDGTREIKVKPSLGTTVTSITEDEARMLARQLLLARNPELAGSEVIDAEIENDDGEESKKR